MKRIFAIWLALLLVAAQAGATVTTQLGRAKYTCNGTTVNYAFPSIIINNSDLQAVKTDGAGVDTTLVQNTDYTVSGAGGAGGATLTLTAGSKCASGYTLTILRNIALTQQTDYVDGEAFSAESIESALDQNYLIQQQEKEKVDRSLKLGKSATATTATTEINAYQFTNRANTYVGYNASGNLALLPQAAPTVTSGSWVDVASYASLNAAVTAVGGTDTVLLIDSITTVTSNLTVPANVWLWVTQKGRINQSTYTLAINSAFDAPISTVFTGTGAVSGLKESRPEWFGLSASATGSANQTALTQAVAAVTTAGTIMVAPGTYTVAGLWTINKACTINLAEATLNYTTDAANQGIRITASDVNISGGTITGPQYTVSTSTQSAIYAYGAAAATPLERIKISDTTISNWGQYGILLEFVTKYVVGRNEIYNVYQAGIQTLSAWKGEIVNNYVHDITSAAGGGVYGISNSRLNDDSLVTYPNSDDVLIDSNRVHNVTNWEGLDTHGGNRVVFSNNIVTGCFIGINVAPARNGAGTSTFASKGVAIANNTIDSLVTDGSMGSGIIFGGASATIRATASIVGNTIKGYGKDSATLYRSYGGIHLQFSDGVAVSGNSIHDCIVGLLSNQSVYGSTITGNTFIDMWGDVAPVAYGIYAGANGLTTGIIEGNVFAKTGAMAAKAQDYTGAIFVSNIAGSSIELGQNYTSIGAALYLNDAGDKCTRGLGSSDTATVTTGEDDLKQVTIPAGRFGAQQRVIIRASGTKTGAAGNKTIKFYFGASSWTVIPAANDQLDWQVEVVIDVTGSATQKLTLRGISGTSVVYSDYSAGTIDLTAEAIIKLTGECANGADTITQTMMTVQYL